MLYDNILSLIPILLNSSLQSLQCNPSENVTMKNAPCVGCSTATCSYQLELNGWVKVQHLSRLSESQEQEHACSKTGPDRFLSKSPPPHTQCCVLSHIGGRFIGYHPASWAWDCDSPTRTSAYGPFLSALEDWSLPSLPALYATVWPLKSQAYRIPRSTGHLSLSLSANRDTIQKTCRRWSTK